MYIDNKHFINKIQFNGIFGIEKRMPSQLLDILKNEIAVLTYLKSHKFKSPTILTYSTDFFVEEFISDVKYNVLNNIPKIAKLLYELHNINVSEEMKQILYNPYLAANTHNTVKLFCDLLHPLPKKIQHSVLFDKIFTYVQDNPFKSIRVSIIHGDLNPNNILEKNDTPYLIDWSDTRVDFPSFDIAQLFYIYNFSAKEQDVFWSYYPDETSILHKNIFLHVIFLILYELGFFYIKNKRIDNQKYLLLRELMNE